MSIDLDMCIGCNACTIACKAEHGTQPGVFWGYVLQNEYGRTPNVTRLFLPVLCNHCEEPSCEEVCPTGATCRDEQGVVLIDYDKCIGCKTCIAACPYGVRCYIEREEFYFEDTPVPHGISELGGYQNVVQKCDLCVDRLKTGGEPKCVEVCPTYCRKFGDLDDDESEVSRALAGQSSFVLRPEVGTKPRIHYLMKRKLVSSA
jgi:molybdopterin-containing oxidoreductase family iron-sulfur binding subunit